LIYGGNPIYPHLGIFLGALFGHEERMTHHHPFPASALKNTKTQSGILVRSKVLLFCFVCG
jgi:hypothetical protein